MYKSEINIKMCKIMNELKGPSQDGKQACEFILKLYLAANPDPDRMCYSHYTTATGVFNNDNNKKIS